MTGRGRGVVALALALAPACGDDGGGDGLPVTETCVVANDAGPTAPTAPTSGALCKHLSSYRLFDDAIAQDPADGLVPFELNTALFSDYTDKLRFAYVPDGQAMQWSDTDSFAMPVGTVLVKTFMYPIDRRDRALGRTLLETRLLVRMDDGWKAGAYVYGDDGDAELKIAGAVIDASWIHDDGRTITNRYAVPNQNQCGNCHEEVDDVLGPIGPKARHLNRPGADAVAIPDQLQLLVDRGVLAGAPPAADRPRAPVFDDPASGTLDARARGWLDINCVHCHNPRGAARTSGLDLSLGQTDPAQFGVCKPPVAAGTGSGGRQFSIVPGMPDRSILTYRLEATEPEVRMPELGRNLVHAESVALMREWIAAMPGSCPTN